MSLPNPIIRVLAHFEPAFTRPTWRKVLVLVGGTLLAHGRRTVTQALRHSAEQANPNFSLFHHVLNRASWSSLKVSRLLLQLLVTTFVAVGADVEIVIDETLERRWGSKITKRGRHRDSRMSARGKAVNTSGLRWVVMTLVVQLPWTRRSWALPFFSVIATTPKVSAQLQKRHKTVVEIAQQMVVLVRRWLPDVPIKLIGDNAYASITLGLCCRAHNVTLIAPLRMDATMYGPPGPRRAGSRGPLPKIGVNLPKPNEILSTCKCKCKCKCKCHAKCPAKWSKAIVRWYDGSTQSIEIASGTGLWRKNGVGVLAVCWVVTRDPSGKHKPKAYFSTNPAQDGLQIVHDFIKRWTIEVTFEESRAHLGIETQRQWSDLAIERSTPSLLGLYSLVALFGQALHPDGKIPVQRTAWYAKTEATFSDVLTEIRRQLWGEFNYSMSLTEPDMLLIPRSHLQRMAQALCA